MTQQIAVFCALPPERNTGMATVDLAAYARLAALVPGAQVTLYSYGAPNSYTYQHGELPYAHLDVREHAERFFSADAIVYWGDFIHTHAYWAQDRGSWSEAAEAFASYAPFVFLTGREELRKKTVVFGSTLITNRAEDALDNTYWPAYTAFFSGVKRVLLRDALSAAKVSPLRGDENTQGCDCAFLLKPEDVALLDGFAPAGERKGVGMFFGRSPARGRMMKFAKALAAETGEEAHWLRWFGTRRRHRLAARLSGVTIPAGEEKPGVLLSQMLGCRFVITDTYHLCVNAWRMGIPAVCIGQGGGATATSLSDKKKEVLFEMLGARSLYAFVENLGADSVKPVAQALRNDALIAAVQAAVDGQRDAAQARLARALHEVLGR